MDQAALIERIVAEVLEQLAPRLAASPSMNGFTGSVASSVSVPTAETETLPDAVITADLLAERVQGRRTVQVRTRAIVTPSARDWLRLHRVELRRVEGGGSPRSTADQWLAVCHTSNNSVEHALADVARQGLVAWRRELVGELDESFSLIVGELCRGGVSHVVVFSAEPEAVACLVNRNDGVRAAVVADAATVRRVTGLMDCNVFVIDPVGRGFYELRTILKALPIRS